MSVHPYRAQYVLAAAADHEILSRTIESWRKLFVGDHQANITEEIAALRHLLGKKLPEHFAYEERQVFPALLADQPPAAKANEVVDLCEEHVALLQDAKVLKAMLATGTMNSCQLNSGTNCSNSSRLWSNTPTRKTPCSARQKRAIPREALI